MRIVKKALIITSVVVGSVVPFSTAAFAGPKISSVAFHAGAPSPTVVITGSGLGTAPRASLVTACHANPANAGDTFGKSGLWIRDSGPSVPFLAGRGRPPKQTCVGLVLSSWSSTSITFTFATDFYGPPSGYLLNAGDNFTISVKNRVRSGQVTFT